MKDYLANLASQADYAKLMGFVERNSRSVIWGAGILPAYSAAPYVYELQGSKRGRFLKKTSEPGHNKHCYFKDAHGDIICATSFSKFVPIKRQWIVCRRFYLHEGSRIVEYIFDSEFESSREAKVSAVHLTVFKEGRAYVRHSLYHKGNYVETLYCPVKDGIMFVKETNYGFVTTERHYRICTSNGLVIVDITNGQHVRMYP